MRFGKSEGAKPSCVVIDISGTTGLGTAGGGPVLITVGLFTVPPLMAIPLGALFICIVGVVWDSFSGTDGVAADTDFLPESGATSGLGFTAGLLRWTLLAESPPPLLEVSLEASGLFDIGSACFAKGTGCSCRYCRLIGP